MSVIRVLARRHALRVAGLFGLLLLASCGGGGDSSDSDGQEEGFYAPAYGRAAQPSAYEADLSSVTDVVVAHQADGQNLVSVVSTLFAVSDGLVEVYANTKIKMISMAKNACPSGLSGCNTVSSSELGVGSNALISDWDTLESTVKSQGERGTCVAFALNAGVEVLVSRQGSSQVSLSEQNTYFEAKRLTDSWDSAGLNPYATVSGVVGGKTAFVSSQNWPYNTADYNTTQDNCADYWATYGSYACSGSEAQGGGSSMREQEPLAARASGHKVRTAHQLYASIGRIKQALYRGYPVMIAVNANYDFLLATHKQGVVSWVFKVDDCGTDLCGHEVMVVG